VSDFLVRNSRPGLKKIHVADDTVHPAVNYYAYERDDVVNPDPLAGPHSRIARNPFCTVNTRVIERLDVCHREVSSSSGEELYLAELDTYPSLIADPVTILIKINVLL